MAMKSLHKPNQFSMNDYSSVKTEGKNFSIFENINISNLSLFYNKEESNFKKKIEKLNSKFYIETDKYLTLKTEIDKTQDQLHLLLFKQITEYIEEIERLNIKLKEYNDKEKQTKQQSENFGKKDEDLEKQTNHFKKFINNLENKLKETKENETKLKKENESFKRQISNYKEQLNLEITDRNINKEKSENNKENNLEKSENFTEISQNNIISHLSSKLHPISQDYTYSYKTRIKKIQNLSEIPNLKTNQNISAKRKKSMISNVNFSENNKKNLNLISRIKNKRSISHLSQPKAIEPSHQKLLRTERKDKYASEAVHKKEISLNDQKKNLTEEKSQIIKNLSKNRTEKINNYICKTVAKSKNLSEKKKIIDVKYNFNQYKNESTNPQRGISNFDEMNSENVELNEIANLFVGNLKDELTLLKNEEEILLLMRNEICEDKKELNFSEDSFKSFKAEVNDNLLSNDLNNQIKTDDTNNYNTLNTSGNNKNRHKNNKINLVNEVDSSLKTKIKGIKFFNK